MERFLTSDHVVGGAAEKQQLGASADAVDMESLWILSAAAQHGVPACAVRAISDAADASMPLDFDRVFNKRGAVSIPKVIGQLATHPLKMGGRSALHTTAKGLRRIWQGFSTHSFSL